MAYRRVTVEERRLIRMWRQAGYGQREVARRLDRSPSTISREIARNSGRNSTGHIRRIEWRRSELGDRECDASLRR